MQVGRYFTMSELCVTSTGLRNYPGTYTNVVNLARLCALVLDPLRVWAGVLIVTSAFRSRAVNTAVGGAASSYHLDGLAVDIQSPTLSPMELLGYIREVGLPVDKVIAENRDGTDWLHIQIAPPGGRNRYEFMTSRVVDGVMVYEPI